jgi:molybdopterin-guanine dinucleotide biosynthesis protein A
MTVVAIVLAGGGSTRFGTDKLAAELDGRPLLHHALEGAAEAADRIVLVLAPAAAVPPLPPGIEHRIEIARDEARHRGPLAGLAAGLARLDADADADVVAIVVGGDMPRLVPAVLRLLAERVAEDGRTAAAALEGDPVPSLPVALRPQPALEAARALLAADRRSLRALLDALRVVTVQAAEWRLLDRAGATLADVDTPADLARDAKTPVPGRKDGRSA